MLGVYKNWYEIRDGIPKKSRYTLGDKIDTRFIQILEMLYIASYQSAADKLPTLTKALTGVDTLKFLMQIAWEVHAIDDKKYISLSGGIQEVGKQVGGWKRGLETKTAVL